MVVWCTTVQVKEIGAIPTSSEQWHIQASFGHMHIISLSYNECLYYKDANKVWYMNALLRMINYLSCFATSIFFSCLLSFNTSNASTVRVVDKGSTALVAPFTISPIGSPYRSMILNKHYMKTCSMSDMILSIVSNNLPSSSYFDLALARSWPLMTRPVREYST